MTSRERVKAMLAGQPVDHLACMPITMMFAADRISVPFLQYSINHEVMVAGQLEVSKDFGIDHVNVMSDPAAEAFDCGATIKFYPNQPPAIDETDTLLSHREALASFRHPDARKPGRMHNRVNALKAYRKRVGSEKWIEGWVEGPCAEGADLRGINTVMTDFYDDPDFVRQLFATIIEMELRFAAVQVEAGADAIGIGDAAASLVGPAVYNEFVWPFEKQLVDGIHALGVPVRLHICGNTGKMLEGMGRLGCEIVDIDYLVPLAKAREAMGPDQILLGNIDPVRTLRDGTPDSVTAAIAACHREAGPRFIVGAGCEVTRDTAPENLLALARYAQTHAPDDL
ncbi:MAG TPA: uroporphyrinogen decarboxylase family protein [Armatimonadota bacterium]